MEHLIKVATQAMAIDDATEKGITFTIRVIMLTAPEHQKKVKYR